jgi:hypothetical protein
LAALPPALGLEQLEARGLGGSASCARPWWPCRLRPTEADLGGMEACGEEQLEARGVEQLEAHGEDQEARDDIHES